MVNSFLCITYSVMYESSYWNWSKCPFNRVVKGQFNQVPKKCGSFEVWDIVKLWKSINAAEPKISSLFHCLLPWQNLARQFSPRYMGVLFEATNLACSNRPGVISSGRQGSGKITCLERHTREFSFFSKLVISSSSRKRLVWHDSREFIRFHWNHWSIFKLLPKTSQTFWGQTEF